MILVVDANILFSSLIKKSFTASILIEQDWDFYAPDFLIEEFLKYKTEILIKMSRSDDDYISMMHILKDIIKVIPKAEYVGCIEEAKKFVPDEKDTMYIALALKLGCAVWSDDKKLKNQDRVRIYTTADIAELFLTNPPK